MGRRPLPNPIERKKQYQLKYEETHKIHLRAKRRLRYLTDAGILTSYEECLHHVLGVKELAASSRGRAEVRKPWKI